MSKESNHGWYVVSTTLVNQSIVLGTLMAGFALFVLPWIDQFNIARTEAMTAVTVLLVVNSLLSPLGGRLLDKISIRTIILIGTLIFSSGLILLSLATSFWMIIAGYATLMPVSLVLCGSLSSQTLVGKWFTKRRGFALGISSLGSSIGGFLLPVLISFLIQKYDWQTTLVILAGIAALLMLPLNFFVLRKDPPTPQAAKNSDQAVSRIA